MTLFMAFIISASSFVFLFDVVIYVKSDNEVILDAYGKKMNEQWAYHQNSHKSKGENCEARKKGEETVNKKSKRNKSTAHNTTPLARPGPRT